MREYPFAPAVPRSARRSACSTREATGRRSPAPAALPRRAPARATVFRSPRCCGSPRFPRAIRPLPASACHQSCPCGETSLRRARQDSRLSTHPDDSASSFLQLLSPVLRSRKLFLSSNFGPLALAAFDHRRQVFAQEESFVHQLHGCFGKFAHVLVARSVALGNRKTRIAGLFTLRGGLWEGNEGTVKAQPQIAEADPRIAQVPSGVRCQRNLQFRQTNTSHVVSVGIRLRNEHHERLADFGRLAADYSLLPLRPEVQVVGQAHFPGLLDSGDVWERRFAERHKCAVCDFRIGAGRRCCAVLHPLVQIRNECPPIPLDRIWIVALLPV